MIKRQVLIGFGSVWLWGCPGPDIVKALFCLFKKVQSKLIKSINQFLLFSLCIATLFQYKHMFLILLFEDSTNSFIAVRSSCHSPQEFTISSPPYNLNISLFTALITMKTEF